MAKVLRKDAKAAVHLPTQSEVAAFQADLAAKNSILDDVYANLDGLKLFLEQSGDTIIPKMFYNSWKLDHYVGKVFVFAPNGCIIACAVNTPGSMHDSTIADYGKLESVY